MVSLAPSSPFLGIMGGSVRSDAGAARVDDERFQLVFPGNATLDHFNSLLAVEPFVYNEFVVNVSNEFTELADSSTLDVCNFAGVGP